MIYYANPCTDAVRDEMSAGRLGCIITPAQGNRTFASDGWDVIADNGCFSAKWEPRIWWSWLMEQDRLSIGTPKSLAADGSLSRFIDRDGIRFNPEGMRIEIENAAHCKFS